MKRLQQKSAKILYLELKYQERNQSQLHETITEIKL